VVTQTIKYAPVFAIASSYGISHHQLYNSGSDSRPADPEAGENSGGLGLSTILGIDLSGVVIRKHRRLSAKAS